MMRHMSKMRSLDGTLGLQTDFGEDFVDDKPEDVPCFSGGHVYHWAGIDSAILSLDVLLQVSLAHGAV